MTTAAVPGVTSEACPLCGAALAPGQDWCMRCGAAARTRLAPAPRWRVPIAILVAIVVLALAAIAAGAVKLAGQTNAPPPIVRTVTTVVPAAPAPTTPPPTGGISTTPTTPGTAGTTNPAAGTHVTRPLRLLRQILRRQHGVAKAPTPAGGTAAG